MEVKEASATYVELSVAPSDALPLGYKQTETGVIPEDWSTANLSDVAWFQEGPGVRNYQFTTSGVKLFNGTNIENGYINLDTTDRYISENEAYGWYRHFLADAGDIVIACSGVSIEKFDEKVGVLSPWDLPLCMNTSTMRFKVKGEQVHRDYFRHFLKSQLFKNQIGGTATGSAQLNFGPAHVSIIEVPLPLYFEQAAIAEALSDADALIESLEQLIAKKRQIKQGTMQALLTGKRRLPGFDGEWQTRRLGDVTETDPENLGSNTKVDFTFSYIALEDVERGVLRSHSEQRFASAPSRARRKLQADDVLVSTVRPNLQSHLLFSIADGHWICSTGFCVVRCRKNVTHPGYVFFHLFANYVHRQIETLLTGSNYPAINSGDVRAIEIPMPEYDEQAAIATILTDMDTELAELETRLAKTHQLKQGMMQELLTGRIRLVQPASNVVPLPEKTETRTAVARSHNQQINEAVVIAALVKQFGSEDWPLARVRRTKLAYLLHRHAEGRADGFLKKAAGPYDPRTRYKGPEGIALKKAYVRSLHNGNYEGFVASENMAEAEMYFEKWYGTDVVAWLEQFRLRKTDELELLTTVDMAVEDLRREGRSISVDAVKQLIHDHPEWKPKLERAVFSDAGIVDALAECQALFAS
jgi:restriction endonuclease S subunit